MKPIIQCIETGVHVGLERIHDRANIPQIASWRCNLIALSHCYNLLFVAFEDAVCVYRPNYPDQSFSTKEELMLWPPASDLEAEGGISPQKPHSITRILVDYLGNSEILLITCDDGDVIGYRIEAVQHAVEEQSRRSSDGDTDDDHEVTAFLHRNVGASAWGLAVHREARMIAVSANTHDITVFAYALSDGIESDDNSGPSDILLVDDEDKDDFPTTRQKNHVITLHGQHNIPSVSFINGGDDPSGRWLFSSAISGHATLWDLHRPHEPARVIQVGQCVGAPSSFRAPEICRCPRSHDCLHAVWDIILPNTKLAQEDPSLDEGIPRSTYTQHFHVQNNQKENFHVEDPANSRWAFVITHCASDGPALPMSLGSMSVSNPIISNHSGHDYKRRRISDNDPKAHYQEEDSDSDVPHGGEQTPALNDFEYESSSRFSDSLSEDENHQLPTAASHSQKEVSTDGGGTRVVPALTREILRKAAQIEAEAVASERAYLEAIEDDVQQDSVPRQSYHPRNYCEINTSTSYKDEVPPCLIISKESLFLINRSFATAGDYTDTISTILRPLRVPQVGTDPYSLQRLSTYHSLVPVSADDRLCYSVEIPELGLVVIASPMGRAAILSFTRSPRTHDGPVVYGTQVERILPFLPEEHDVVWSVLAAKLVGIAVGPVQGKLDSEIEGGGNEMRRWRLLMYYSNHTVLSYEVMRWEETVGVSEAIG